jgi:hypothetical protein
MEDNKLIAEFMGHTFADYDLGGLHYLIDGNYVEYNSLQYDASWDWLMPVVEKIENDGLDPHELIDKSLRKNNQKRWRSIEDLYNVAVYLIKIHNNG